MVGRKGMVGRKSMFIGCAAAAALAGAGSAALAQSTITLFGQTYTVQRFDYSNDFQVPNPYGTPATIPFIEAEGTVFRDGKLLLSADDLIDFANAPDNMVIEVNLDGYPGAITGLSYSRTILFSDQFVAGYDLNPTGITVNTGATGTGAGGNLLVQNGGGLIFAFSLQAGSLGQRLNAPSTQNCNLQPNPVLCSIDLTSRNTNAEDIAYFPGSSTLPAAFYVINQDDVAVEVWGVDGGFIRSFPVGNRPGQPQLNAPKGLTFLPESATLPPALRGRGGVFLVAFDDLYPALRAFDAAGNEVALEIMTTDGTATGPSRLDVTGCPRTLFLESLNFDATTGRLFLTNQGSLTFCTYLWVLTPEAAPPSCRADLNNDGELTFDDIQLFVQLYNASDARADFNNDQEWTFDDIQLFIQLYNAGC